MKNLLRMIFFFLLIPALCLAVDLGYDASGNIIGANLVGKYTIYSTDASKPSSGMIVGEKCYAVDTKKFYIADTTTSWKEVGGGSFSGTLDDIAAGTTNVHLTTTLKGNYDTAYGWGNWAHTTLSGYGITDAQGLNSNLTSLGGLSWSSGSPLVKMTAANTFGLDTTTYISSLTTSTPTNLTGFIKGNGSVLSADNSNYLTTAGTAADSSKLGGSLPAAYALVGQTMYIGTTSHAINRTTGSEALTGITSIDGSSASCTGNAATSTKFAATKTINGTAFDGSANIDAVPTWQTGITTRDITTASGTVNVAHGLGRIPKMVRVKANLYQALTPPVTTECEGVYDGTHHSGICTMQSEGTTVISVDAVYSSTAFELGFGSAYNINPYTGATRQTATITVDGTNIIFTWTKTGTVASAVANILWEAQ